MSPHYFSIPQSQDNLHQWPPTCWEPFPTATMLRCPEPTKEESNWQSSTSNDSMTRVNDSTRVTIFGDSNSTRVTLREMVTRLDSQFSQNDSSQGHFYKISEAVMYKYKPSSFAHKEMSNFASVIAKIGANFRFWLSGRAMLHFKDQVSSTCTEIDRRLCFHWGVS